MNYFAVREFVSQVFEPSKNEKGIFFFIWGGGGGRFRVVRCLVTTSPECPTDTGLHFDKACYPVAGKGRGGMFLFLFLRCMSSESSPIDLCLCFVWSYGHYTANILVRPIIFVSSPGVYTICFCWHWWLNWMCIWLVIRRLQVRPRRIGNILSWHLIMKYFLVILSLPLIQEGQLSVSGVRMCKILDNGLED